MYDHGSTKTVARWSSTPSSVQGRGAGYLPSVHTVLGDGIWRRGYANQSLVRDWLGYPRLPCSYNLEQSYPSEELPNGSK